MVTVRSHSRFSGRTQVKSYTRKNMPPSIKFPDKVYTVPTNPGIYVHYDKSKDPLYVGSTNNLRKRLKTYYLNDHSHPNNHLRNGISYTGYKQMPTNDARSLERQLKYSMPENMDFDHGTKSR